MAFNWRTQRVITCLSTDTKPVLGEEHSGWILVELDTSTEYYWDGTSWVERIKRSDNYVWDTDLLAFVAMSQPLVKTDSLAVTVASIPLPSGAATSAKQDTLIGLARGTDLEGAKVSVGTDAVEMTFTGAPICVIITADFDNTGTIFVGKSNVTSAGANALTFLRPGESVAIDYDDSTNALYAVASVASQNVWKGCLK